MYSIALRENRSASQRGFSLMEICIAIAVVALLIGGVLYGKNALRAAELRTVLKQVNEIKNAMQQFKAQYNALPGDMNNATAFWGTDAGCTQTPYNEVPKQQTCNGNGNLQIGLSGNGAQNYERFRAFQHLRNAGFINGNFSGSIGTTVGFEHSHSVPGVNVAESPLEGAGYTITWIGTVPLGNPSYFEGYYNNIIRFGAEGTTSTDTPVISREEARTIDVKIDDGRPGTGTLRHPKRTYASTPQCVSTNVSTTAAYNMGGEPHNILCILDFITGL